jgi:hypothetical protein
VAGGAAWCLPALNPRLQLSLFLVQAINGERPSRTPVDSSVTFLLSSTKYNAGTGLMSKHTAILRGSCGPSRHLGARPGLRPLRGRSRCKRPDVSVHRGHPFRRVHERQRSEALARAALTRGARSGLRRPGPVRCHNAFRWIEHHLHAEQRSRHGRSLLHRASPHGGWRKAMLNGRLSPLPRHLRKD